MQNFIKTIISAVQVWTSKKIKDSIPKNVTDLLNGDKIPGHAVEDMYYTIPPVLDNTFPEQTFKMRELTSDDRYQRDDVPTYGYDISDFIAADHGITTELFGQIFTVVWDGAEYQCEAHDPRLEMFVLGNASIVDGDEDDTGEPFCIFTDPPGWWDLNMLFIRTNEPGIHTVAFGKAIKQGEFKRMPKQYLPDYAIDGIRTAYIAKTAADNAQIAADNAQIAADNAQIIADNALTTADNAVTYAESKMNASDPIGTGSFSMNRKSGTIVGEYSHAGGYDTEASGYYSYAIGHGTCAGGRSRLVSGEYNANRLVYVDDYSSYISQTVIFSNTGNFYYSNNYIFDSETGRYTLVSPTLISAKQISASFFNNNQNVLFVSDGNKLLDSEISGTCLHGYSPDLKVGKHNSYYQKINGYSMRTAIHTTTERGKYVHIVGNGTSDADRSNAHTLDWNGVGWYQGGLQVGGNAQDDGAKNVLLEGDAIPVPETASIGQILAVKSVDENGKITECETIDAPTGGGNIDDEYINSLIDAKLNAIPNAAEVAY